MPIRHRILGADFQRQVVEEHYAGQTPQALSRCHDLSRNLIPIEVYAGLGGETPTRCWARLVEAYGVGAPPDTRRRRLALGTRLSRTVQTTGLIVWGVRYQSETLAGWRLHSRDRKVRVRWYSEDIGAVFVEMDGGWIEVPAVFERFAGVRAQTWRVAARQLGRNRATTPPTTRMPCSRRSGASTRSTITRWRGSDWWPTTCRRKGWTGRRIACSRASTAWRPGARRRKRPATRPPARRSFPRRCGRAGAGAGGGDAAGPAGRRARCGAARHARLGDRGRPLILGREAAAATRPGPAKDMT